MTQKRIVEALWDCPYCGAKGIGGLTKTCPSCGHPQDAGTKFYMGEKKNYVDEKKAENYGKGADWTCAYCGALNRYDAKECSGCGAAREESQSDYFQNQETNEQKAQETAREEAQFIAPTPPVKKKRNWKKLLIGLGAAALVLILLIALLVPKTDTATISSKDWERSISIEEYQTVTESDWSVPEGGRLMEQHEEVYGYDHVLDHYETVEVQKSRRVEDGYDTETDYQDNGDGTFTEVTRQVPRYKTEYYTEYEQQPVYIPVPIYMTKYTYEIERWVPTRTADSSGHNDEPYWEDSRITRAEREGSRSDAYAVTLTGKKGRTYQVRVSEEIWNDLQLDKPVKIKTSGSRVTEINGLRVG